MLCHTSPVVPWRTVSKGGILNPVAGRLTQDDGACPGNKTVTIVSTAEDRRGFERNDARAKMCVWLCISRVDESPQYSDNTAAPPGSASEELIRSRNGGD